MSIYGVKDLSPHCGRIHSLAAADHYYNGVTQEKNYAKDK